MGITKNILCIISVLVGLVIVMIVAFLIIAFGLWRPMEFYHVAEAQNESVVARAFYAPARFVTSDSFVKVVVQYPLGEQMKERHIVSATWADSASFDFVDSVTFWVHFYRSVGTRVDSTGKTINVKRKLDSTLINVLALPEDVIVIED